MFSRYTCSARSIYLAERHAGRSLRKIRYILTPFGFDMIKISFPQGNISSRKAYRVRSTYRKSHRDLYRCGIYSAIACQSFNHSIHPSTSKNPLSHKILRSSLRRCARQVSTKILLSKHIKVASPQVLLVGV